MKITLRVMIIYFTALFVICLWYPAIHEAGHIIAAQILQIEVMSASLFPAQVSLNLTEPTAEQLLLLSFGADMLIPVLWLIPSKRMLLYYVKLTATLLFFFDAIGSLLDAAMYILYGSGGDYDDAVTILVYSSESAGIVLLLLAIEAVLAGVVVYLMHPICRTIHFLDKKAQITERKPRFV